MGIVFETITRDLIAVLVVLISVAYYFVRRTYNYWQDKGLNFEQPSFPFGNFKDAFMQRKSMGDRSLEIYNSTDEPVIGIWSALQPTLFVRDPNIVRQIFITDFSTFHDRGLYCNEKSDPLSGHLFLLPGDKWKRLRGKLTPTFTSGKLKAMFTTIVECGGTLDAFVDRAATNGESVKVSELLAEYTTNIIASVAFGIDVDCITDPDNEFRKNGRMMSEPSFMKALRGTTMLMFPNLLRWTGMKTFDSGVEKFMIDLVRQNMEYRENNNVTRKDFFQLLLQLRNTGKVQEDDNFTATASNNNKSLSIEECAAQSFVFFAAGFETSATTMSFALYEFARNPECMRRAQEEIDEVLARHDGQLTYESAAEMKYMEWSIDETLRIYSPVPYLNRETSAPWNIPNTNITLEKGTAVIIPTLALQHDAKYWPNPEKFIPERFSPEQSADLTFVDRPYMPFGEGPRSCIGLRLGKLQAKVGLITMLQKYNYELAGVTKEPLKMSASAFLLNPIGGINLSVTHRNKK